ncbi:MAG: BON domain-containing protein [Pseudomonadales bacterium]|nr:BON domain-containing protein [Pseudomonadales bacterium]
MSPLRILTNLTLLCLLTTLPLTGCVSLLTASSGPQGIDTANGKRTWGRTLEDQAIETKAYVNLRKSLANNGRDHIVVVSFNGIALLLGQISNDKQRKIATNTVKNIRHVRKVHDKLTIGPQTSYGQRIADAWKTYQIKSQLLFAENFPSGRVKVVTEKGVVYLLGLMTEKEADHATAVARSVRDVKKVVKAFEFIR